ncbi:MAG: 50S ribosomal protein L9 [Gammaproteobacteria bacterium]|jgi:large subunit ribosomal protein L9|nr:50S ribosomal protein L9 [Gammaproteobacteria bacterium]
MQVILLEEVQNLGNLGDEVKVKSGYARNYLIPYGRAVIANEENRTVVEARHAELERVHNDALTKARERADKMDGASVQLVRKVGEEGKLFGSVSTRDIAEAMQAAGYDLQKSEIHLAAGPLKDVGDHEIAVTLHPEIDIKITVSIAGEE